MFCEKLFHLRCLVVGCGVNKEDDFFQAVPLCVGNKVVEVFAELNISAAGKAVPDNAFLRPKKCYKTVHAISVAECGHKDGFPAGCPATFHAWQEFDPFLVLECNGYSFFKRADETRL